MIINNRDDIYNNRSLDLADNQYFTAFYMRISKDDEEEKESQSIENQRKLIQNYIVDHNNINCVIEIIDDGYSGLNFERPGFKIMMNLMKTQKINCIVVKDLSRLGRNFLEVGELMERTFPLNKVRLIAINDYYDSENNKKDYNYLQYSFQNLINELYSLDISTKTKSHLKVKRRNGEFVGAFACYGYKKSGVDKNKLVVDTYAADIVRNIFQMKIKGMSQGRITDWLNDMGILSPSSYKKITNMKYVSGFSKYAESRWTVNTVTRILKNETYLGYLIQGKEEKCNIKVNKKVRKDKEEWCRVENCHEAIISKDDFETVNRLLCLDTRVSPTKKELYILSGLILCKDCGQNLIRKKSIVKNKTYCYYICSTYIRDKSCSSHRVNEEYVKQSISTILYLYLRIQLPNREVDIENNTSYIKLIDRVFVFDKERMEVIFHFHDILKGVDYYS